MLYLKKFVRNTLYHMRMRSCPILLSYGIWLAFLAAFCKRKNLLYNDVIEVVEPVNSSSFGLHNKLAICFCKSPLGWSSSLTSTPANM